MAKKIDYSEPSSDHQKMKPYWDRVDVLVAGQDEVLASGESMLPKFPDETAEAYTFRKSVAKYTNILRDILESLAAKPFEKEVQLAGKINPEIETFCENVDGDGNNLTKFAADVFFNGIQNAVDWLFIDHPVSVGVRTLAEMKSAGVRPYWSRVLARNMLEARVQFINGSHLLTYARFLENPKVGEREVKIFERSEKGVVTWRLMQETKDDWVEIGSGQLSITLIPLVPFITGRRDGKSFYFIPALVDAVNLQRTLFQQESGLEYAKVMTAFPMLCGSGVSPKKGADGNPAPMKVGPQVVLFAPPDGNGNIGDWKYIEPSANSLKFLSDDVTQTKQDLRELGKQPLTAQSSNLTVVTTAYAAGKSKSAVRAWGLGLKDVLEQALKITAQYMNLKDVEPEISVFDEYDDFSDDDTQHVSDARKNGDLSQETYWAELKRRGVLSPEFDPKKERLLILKEVPGDTSPDDENDDDISDPEPAPGNAPKNKPKVG